MLKINRPEIPNISVYTEKKHTLKEEVRSNLLNLIDETSVGFNDFVPRLRDKDEKYSKAEKETLEAINYYADPKNFENNVKKTNKKAPSFTVYKDKELKEEIKKLSDKKCAYCDSSFLANSNADIEHFRPKKAFNPFKNNEDEDLIEPGYYWLAADWHNLLWSCILCNRRNNLDLPNEVGLAPLGKKNRFPLTDETKRIRSHNQDLEKETTLLLILDPCSDDPNDHLEFPTNDEDLGIVKAKIQENGEPSPKAIASIPLYGLNRLELVLARKETALDLTAIFLGLLATLQTFTRKKSAGEDATNEASMFKIQKDRFKAKFSQSSNFLSMKRTLLKDFQNFPLLVQMGLKVEKLLE